MKLTRLALIGARGHYDWVLRSLPKLPDVRVVGLSDGGTESIRSLIEWCQRRADEPRICGDHVELLQTVRPEAVVICGAMERHAEMAIDAVRRGVHVLMEKPAALTFDDLERLRQALAENPHVHLAALQTARYQPGFYTAWQLVRAGAIGDVRLINAQKSYKLGRRAAFYARRETYGGTIPWVGAHAIDWMLWIGGHHVRSVFATHTAIANDRNGTMESAAMCHFTLCGERYASISIDMLRPSSAPSHGDDRLRVVGKEGVLDVRPNQVTLINADNDGRLPLPLQTPPGLFEDFVAHVEGRGRALIDAADTLATTAACLLARQSADEGRPLDAKESAGALKGGPKAATASRNASAEVAAVA